MMSSNMNILKNCAYCRIEFFAKKTTTKTCSDNCAKRLYKQNQRNQKIQHTETIAEIQRNNSTLITEADIKVIQCKEHLTLKEAAILINISALTLRRWVLAGKLNSVKVGKKHMFNRSILSAFIDSQI
ncbi:MAG: hypothetical protein ABS68_01225 [Niastella sp. SCN 39-18]|nr:MAG: hypothetical protein ABS68_01225 [Niastella sp. SCN 39-18]